jgi:hypothetical protein
MGMNIRVGVEKEKPQINPIWRGIGCILMVVAPLVAFAMTVILIPVLEASGYVPMELLGYVHFPPWVMKVPFLSFLASFIGGINNLYLGIVVFIVVLLLLSGIFSMIYVAILQVIGPPRYSEMDAPPSRTRAKKYKR